ncbi:ATP synthase F0 subcomplex A subunit [Desulfacinum hydrothermale DSM 13146]|uniref:ATP synthase subunit a n=1 Tax=Desulfacinum hydrothermale DSM 13146 TaxID=1121390 RepID=A0A1W1WZ72_9BACT|nr:F0F1 ATP synthase subunit A [Desulfacinum hydrothermale]SMC16850.1 ATP synthase F0 subcomplex A subunit [Desulfacinum hydrothermale DSM 13146]
MEDLTKVWTWTLDVAGFHLVFNATTIVMTLIIMGLLIAFGWLATRRTGLIPNPFQIVAELFVDSFWNLTKDALDEDMAKTYFPMICSLFMFLLLCNWIGIVPHMEEPTKDLNTPLGLGIMGFFIAHYAGIKTKGFGAYIKEYFEPIFFMMPLNVIGELAKVISISFRLYGNIMGGSIIILVVSHLVYGLIIPPFLYGFFGVFVGTVQAFVFTMLTLVYISVQVK